MLIASCTVPGHMCPTGKRVFEINNTVALDSSMPVQRKTNHCELSPIKRAYLMGRHDAGESFVQISRETGVPKSTVIDTVQNTTKRGHTNSLPRGRPPCKTDLRDERILHREVTKGPQARRMPLAELQANFQPSLSRSTL
jgi:hypothetical protein